MGTTKKWVMPGVIFTVLLAVGAFWFYTMEQTFFFRIFLDIAISSLVILALSFYWDGHLNVLWKKVCTAIFVVIVVFGMDSGTLQMKWKTRRDAAPFTAGLSLGDRAKLDAVIYDESQWPIRLRYTTDTPRSADYTRLIEAYIDKNNKNAVYSHDSGMHGMFYGIEISSGAGATTIKIGVKKYKD